MALSSCGGSVSRRAFATVLATLALTGCKADPLQIPCMTLGGPGGLVQQAQSVRLEIYSASARCDGQSTTDGVLQDERLFMMGEAISLDVPPGHHAVIVETYSDTAGNELTGRGCREFDFQAGSQVCLDVTIDAASNPDLGTDMAAGCTGASCACTALPDSCPTGQYCAADGQCAAGCKLDSDCDTASDGGVGDGGMAAGRCDTGLHQCVQSCDSSGAGCPPGRTCCNKLCIDTSGDALNCGMCGKSCGTGLCCKSACVSPQTDVANCGACGRACAGTHVATAACAGGVCTSSCLSGYGNCAQPSAPAADDGCETNTNTDPGNCGKCGRACSAAGAATLACTGGLCTSSCATGHGNCIQPASPAADDGCETNTATDLANCGMCTNQCTAAPHSTAACSASMCGVGMCAANFQNCDAQAANGCECPGSGCCGAACEFVHNNGSGQNFYDCAALGTINQTQAMEACAAYTGNMAQCHALTCTSGKANGELAVCSDGSPTDCICWAFTNGTVMPIEMGAGHVFNAGRPGFNNCGCVFGTDPTWN